MDRKIKVGIVGSDVHGVSYESTLKNLPNADINEICTAIFYNDEDKSKATQMAKSDVESGKIDVLVTSEGEEQGLTMFCCNNLRLAVASGDIENLTSEVLAERLRQCYASANRDFLCAATRVAVLEAQKHDKDTLLLTAEEEPMTVSVVSELFEEGLRVFGPYAAEKFFAEGQYKHFDVILATSAQQAKEVLETVGVDAVVRYAANQHLVMCSPLDGELSLLQAIYTAIDVFRNRTLYDRTHANPLPHNAIVDRREDRRVRREA